MNGRALLLVVGLLAGPLQAAEGAEAWQRIRITGECRPRGTDSVCLLRFPDRELRNLIVDIPAEDQVVGFRFYTSSPNTWDLEASGLWHPAPLSRHRIQTVNTLWGGPVRLELFGQVRPPRLAGVEADAGRPRFAPQPPLGPASEASRAVFALEDTWFPLAWPVRADAARPGDTVRLELPAEVLARLGRYERSGLRVATPEGQLPWTVEIEDLPRAQVEMAEARWIPAERPGWLRLSLPDLPEGLAYTEVQLIASPQPLARRVLVEEEESLWTCVPEPPLPCRLALGFYVNRWPPRRLPEIEIEGGEGNPLPPLRVSVLRQTEYLVFVWPAQGPVRLLAGNDRVSGSSTISLLEINPRADDRPWKRAELGPEERLPLFRRWHRGGAAFVTLVLVGLCLKEWRRRRLVAALLLVLCAAPAWGKDVFLEQTLEVPEAGWVRVPLDLETLARLGPERRWLRVLGPQGTELPAGVWLETELPPDINGRLPEGSPEVRTFSSSPACERAGSTTHCLLRLPAPGQVPRELRVAIAGAEPGEKAGLRLIALQKGRRKVLAEGIREASGGGVWHLPLEAEPLAEVLGLELDGLRGPQRPVRAELDLAPASLVFEAAEPGVYRLVLGQGWGPEEGRRPFPFNATLSTLEPGPARERPLPPLPGETVAPRGALADVRIDAEWTVRAPGVAAGGVVRLELPVDVYLRAGSLDRLRLETAGRQIPYVLRTLELPAPVARGRIAPGHDRVSFDVPLSLPLLAWRLETGKPVSVWLMSGFWTSSPLPPRGDWRCDPGPLSSCVAEAQYARNPAPAQKIPSLRILHGDFSGDIDVTLVRERHEMVFVWPGEGAIRLLAGAEGGAAPAYDLHAIADQLLARSWKPAVLGPGVEHSAPGSQKTRKALLGAAALVLLAAVHRLMPRSPSPPPAGLR
jgi:hypothetical protein